MPYSRENIRKKPPLMIFGALEFPSFETSSNAIFGARVATQEFYRALIQYGGFDEYHFFLRQGIYTSKDRMLQKFIANKNVRIKKIEELPLCLQNTRYTVFFTCEPCLARLSNLRSRYARQNFPVCGMTHAMSYQFILKDVIFSNLVSNLYPFDSIICTSNAVLRAYRNLNMLVRKSFLKAKGLSLDFGARLDQLPLGINTDAYGKIDKFEARRKILLPKDKIILLYFGRFSIFDKMDLGPLLTAFKNLLSKNKNVILLLAGKDRQEPYLERYAARVRKLARDMGIISQVRFCLDPSPKRKYLLYSASDIFVSPSDNIQESFGLTVLEAMASGLPVVVSDWNGYKDIVIHDKVGFKIPTYWTSCDRDISHLSQIFLNRHLDHLSLSQSVCVDVTKMTEYLSVLVRRKDLRQRFGLEARKRILEKYDWRILIPVYEKLWRRLWALSENYKIKKKTEVFVPNYFASFAYYASKLINKGSQVSISQDGIFAVKTKMFPRILPEIQHLISIQIIFIILTFLLKENTSTVEKIQNYVKGIFRKASADNISYHIMWLLKKNLLTLW